MTPLNDLRDGLATGGGVQTPDLWDVENTSFLQKKFMKDLHGRRYRAACLCMDAERAEKFVAERLNATAKAFTELTTSLI